MDKKILTDMNKLVWHIDHSNSDYLIKKEIKLFADNHRYDQSNELLKVWLYFCTFKNHSDYLVSVITFLYNIT